MLSISDVAALFAAHCALDRGADAVFLPGWTTEDWEALLQQARVLQLERDDVLIRRGESESSVFLVADGALEVNGGVGGSTAGAPFREGPGSVIGEIAFFDGGTRSATVWAVAPSQLLALQRQDIEAFASSRPARGLELLFALGRMLAYRVRRSEQGRPADPL